MESVMTSPGSEAVLVVPRAAIARLQIVHGFVSDAAIVEKFLHIVSVESTLMLRAAAERDPGHVQPIPLAYIQWQDRLLAVPGDDRDPADRLYDRCTIWVGGHVDEVDVEGGDAIGLALARELAEELPSVGLPAPELVGLVADGSTARSQMHLGVVHRIVIADPVLARALERPDGNARGEPRTVLLEVDALIANFDRMEPWSQLILRERGLDRRAVANA
jgi:predicted NUDIX family phosphoesterase